MCTTEAQKTDYAKILLWIIFKMFLIVESKTVSQVRFPVFRTFFMYYVEYKTRKDALQRCVSKFFFRRFYDWIKGVPSVIEFKMKIV